MYKETRAISRQNVLKCGSDPYSASTKCVQKTNFRVHQTKRKNAERRNHNKSFHFGIFGKFESAVTKPHTKFIALV